MEQGLLARLCRMLCLSLKKEKIIIEKRKEKRKEKTIKQIIEVSLELQNKQCLMMINCMINDRFHFGMSILA
jgi:hypothetical protein